MVREWIMRDNKSYKSTQKPSSILSMFIHFLFLLPGFLKTDPKKIPSGMLDVIAAVHWVRENCDSFGGDRNRITLLGYRTGAVIANLLLIAQIAKG